MKRTVIVLLSVIAAMMTPIGAQSESLCSSIYSLAERIMQKRQAGVPLPKLMNSLDGLGNNPVYDLGKILAVQAYETPRYNSDDSKTKAAEDFANEAATDCYIAELKKKVLEEKSD